MRTLTISVLTLALAACSQAPQSPMPPTSSAAATTSGAATSAAPAASSSTGSAAAALAKKFTLPAAQALAMLPRYHWQLVSAEDVKHRRIDALFPRPDKPLQLDFTAHGVAASNTCNRMRATYSTAGSDMRIGSLAATLMACNDPKLQALDKAVSTYLGSTREYMVSRDTPPQLAIMTAGAMLLFNGVPTAETRFGSAGTTEFLEVAPQTKPCNNPGMPHAQCLYVRELHYDAKGLREGNPGAWQVLGQTIEGYTHKDGVRNVLRVKRYTVAHPPADGSSVAYVLDLVVESGTAPASH